VDLEQEQVERVAEAIYHTSGGMTDEDYEAVMCKRRRVWKTDAPWDTNPDELAEHERDEYRTMAKAAIAAMTMSQKRDTATERK